MRALVVAVGVLAGIVVLGFGLQVVALGRPSAARLEVVRTLGRLVLLDESQAALNLNGKRYSAACGEGRSGRQRVSSVVIDGFRVLTVVNGGLVRRRPLTIAQFELAACPRSLIGSLRIALAHRTGLRVIATTLGGRRVLLLRIREGETPLELYVARSNGLPVRLALLGKRWHGGSVVRYPEVS